MKKPVIHIHISYIRYVDDFIIGIGSTDNNVPNNMLKEMAEKVAIDAKAALKRRYLDLNFNKKFIRDMDSESIKLLGIKIGTSALRISKDEKEHKDPKFCNLKRCLRFAVYVEVILKSFNNKGIIGCTNGFFNYHGVVINISGLHKENINKLTISILYGFYNYLRDSPLAPLQGGDSGGQIMDG